MTHSLHRHGDRASLSEDYIVYMLTEKGAHEKGSTSAKKEFLDILLRHNADNVGSVIFENRVSIGRGATVQQLIDNVTERTEVLGVFRNKQVMKEVLKETKERDLGLSIVVSALIDETFDVCKDLSIVPHSINMSGGIMGKTELLPNDNILDIATMCGHGMVSRYLVEEMLARVKKGKTTPEEAAREIGGQCLCGIFNRQRCSKILKGMCSCEDSAVKALTQ